MVVVVVVVVVGVGGGLAGSGRSGRNQYVMSQREERPPYLRTARPSSNLLKEKIAELNLRRNP